MSTLVASDEHSKLSETLGLQSVVESDREAGRVVLEFLADQRHCHSSVQGGFVTAWIDMAMARVVWLLTDGQYGAATLEMKVAFYRPAFPGERLRAEAWAERMGKSTAFLEGRLVNEKGEVVAKGSSTAKLADVGRRRREVSE